ncbi:MAG: FHA domain-containing protein [Woeseiaceae bacterium]|nr:FHA domain-containing protein [Woeseiaceae bacterium]
MALLAADINDAGITVLSDDSVIYREPGFALLEDDGLTTGNAAYVNARIKPRRIHDHYWSNLSTDALPDQRFRHLSSADLVSRQIEQLWDAARAHGDRLVVAVPSYMQSANLGLFLGICNEIGVPVVALVDAAVAATRREYANATPVHVDMSLHSALLTRMAQPGQAQVDKTAVVEDNGLAALYQSWISTLAETFVQQSRFDPLHTAETEQMLLDRIPRWLSAAAGGGTIGIDVEYRGISHHAEIDSLTLVSAAAPVYQRIVSQLRALCRADETPAIQLTDRAARMPGLADMLKARVGGEVFLLESAATARGLLNRCRDMQRGGDVSLIRKLPWDQSTVELSVEAQDSAGGRPTHILYGNTAYALNGEALSLGSQAVAGERWIDFRDSMPGLSRKHCTLSVENGQCVVRDYSRYGTFLNGHRLDGSAVLQVGDLIRLGTPGFELRLITTEVQDGA